MAEALFKDDIPLWAIRVYRNLLLNNIFLIKLRYELEYSYAETVKHITKYSMLVEEYRIPHQMCMNVHPKHMAYILQLGLSSLRGNHQIISCKFPFTGICFGLTAWFLQKAKYHVFKLVPVERRFISRKWFHLQYINCILV